MSTPTDEAAADSAQDAGDRHRTAAAALPKLWACEPARWKKKGAEHFYRWYWLEVPPILFHSPRPTCDRCGCEVRWMGPPERRGELLVYQVMCRCLEVKEDGLEYVVTDEIEVDFPLRMGGTAAWWKENMGINV